MFTNYVYRYYSILNEKLRIFLIHFTNTIIIISKNVIFCAISLDFEQFLYSSNLIICLSMDFIIRFAFFSSLSFCLRSTLFIHYHTSNFFFVFVLWKSSFDFIIWSIKLFFHILWNILIKIIGFDVNDKTISIDVT